MPARKMVRRAARAPRAGIDAERLLMQRIAAGDQVAFATLYRQQAMLLFSVIYHIVRDQKDAEDVLQEAFLQIWRKAAFYEAGRSSVSTWSIMIARHRAIDKLRTRRRYSEGRDTFALEHLSPHHRLCRETTGTEREDGDWVRQGLETIDEKQREAISLAFFSGLTHAEIAAYLETPLGTVKARIRRGLLALREVMAHVNSPTPRAG